MIAHRLTTIQSAENLLYLEDASIVKGAAKGTKEYEDIMDKLTHHNYAHQ